MKVEITLSGREFQEITAYNERVEALGEVAWESAGPMSVYRKVAKAVEASK